MKRIGLAIAGLLACAFTGNAGATLVVNGIPDGTVILQGEHSYGSLTTISYLFSAFFVPDAGAPATTTARISIIAHFDAGCDYFGNCHPDREIGVGGMSFDVGPTPSAYVATASFGARPPESYVIAAFSDPTNGTLTISSAPEPATWAMMIGGFGLVGVGLRRRKQAASFNQSPPVR